MSSAGRVIARARVVRLARAGALGLLVTFNTACPRSKTPASTASVEDAGARSEARLGIRVPLPEGWSAQVSADGSFRAGPAGRPLLRIDREPGAGSELPTPEVLKGAFLSGLHTFSVRTEDVSHSTDFVGVRLTLSRAGQDGGVSEQLAMLGARKVGADLFLCSTAPGATTAEVSAGLKSCEEIGLAPAEAP